MADTAMIGARTPRDLMLALAIDPASVTVRSDARAAEAARTMKARAYTLGSEIVFGRGEVHADLRSLDAGNPDHRSGVDEILLGGE
jgi:hypothetical protein